MPVFLQIKMTVLSQNEYITWMVEDTCLGFLSFGPSFNKLNVYYIWNRVAVYQKGTLEGFESGRKEFKKYDVRRFL